MKSVNVTIQDIYGYLAEVSDPEVPVLSIVDLGIVRNVKIGTDSLIVEITPTYSGCPAMKEIERKIILVLKSKGINSVRVKTVFSPPWTSDWMSKSGKRKLKEYGIAPPLPMKKELLFSFSSRAIPCPHCESDNTLLKSEFGSTACKALYYCNSCQQPFEHFKCH